MWKILVRLDFWVILLKSDTLNCLKLSDIDPKLLTISDSYSKTLLV